MSEEETGVDPVAEQKAALAAGVESPNQGDTEVEYTDVEAEAMEHGWNPDGAPGKRNLTAEEFLDRQPLYDDIRTLKKETRKLREGLDAALASVEGARKRAAEAAIADLKAAKAQALENEEYDTVVAIDERLVEEKEAAKAPVPNRDFETWVDENEWYHQDSDMKQYADTIGAGYYQQDPNRPMRDVYEFVAKEVKARFPEKFGNVNRERPNSVESASKGRKARTGAKHSAKELSDEERRIMRTIVRTGSISEAEYLKQYFSQ